MSDEVELQKCFSNFAMCNKIPDTVRRAFEVFVLGRIDIVHTFILLVAVHQSHESSHSKGAESLK